MAWLSITLELEKNIRGGERLLDYGCGSGIVVANILAAPLIALEPLLAALTRAGGRVALSGICR